MLLIVDKSVVNNFREVDNTKIYNINTLHEGFIDASILFNIVNTKELDIYSPSSHDLIANSEDGIYSIIKENFNIDEVKEFDILYKNIIYNNDNYFKIFFSMIFDLYLNMNVVLAVDFSRKNSEFIIESLTKLVQQVYEYSSTYIYNEDDINNIKYNEAEFGITGLYNLDIDKKRFLNLVTSEELKELDKKINESIK